MNIFELTAEMANLEAELEENGGELTEEIAERYQLNQDAMAAKVDNYASLIAKYDAQIKAAKEAKQKLDEKVKVLTNAQANIKEFFLGAMNAFGYTKLEGSIHKASIRNSSSMEITDEAAFTSEAVNQITNLHLPDYITVKVSVSKKVLTDMSKGGDLLPDGASLVSSQSLIFK